MTLPRATIGLLLLTALGSAVPATAQDSAYGAASTGYDTDGQSVDSIAVFFEPLSHYGRWLDGRYGREWSPNVPRDWRPYTIGHWEDGAYGPTWRSDEPFGWAVFHFGRWAFDPPVGWVWLPDTVWGPAWVAWRDGDDVTGWAPLPPQASVTDAGYALNDWSYDQWYQPGWIYVPRGFFYARSLRGSYLPSARSRDLWDRTRGTTRYDRVGDQIVNRSFGDGRRGDGRGAPPPRGAMPFSPPPRGVAPAYGGDPRGFAPPPRGYDGFVPGSPPRGFDRRALPVAPGRPLPPFAATRPAGVTPSAPPRPAPAPVHRDSHPADRPH